MRTLLILTAACVVLAAQEKTTTATIEKLDAAWGKAILAKDVAQLDKLLSADLIYGHASGVLDTKKNYLDKIQSGRQIYQTLEQKKIIVRLQGNDNAVTHSWMHMAGVNAAGKFDDKLMMLHVWAKQNGVWHLVAHQTAKVDKIPD